MDDVEPESTDNIATSWLPESVITVIPQNEDDNFTNTLGSISRDVMNSSFGPASMEYDNSNDTYILFVDDVQMLFQNEDVAPDVCSQINEEVAEIQPNRDSTVTHSREVDDTTTYHMTLETAEKAALAIGKDITDLFSEERIHQLKVPELDHVYESVCIDLPNRLKVYKKSWRKAEKVSFLCGVFGFNQIPSDQLLTHPRVKRKSPPSLRKLSLKMIQAKSYPKMILSASYAAHIFPNELQNWQQNCPFDSPTEVEGLDNHIPSWYSYPEMRENGLYLAKGTDCSHNLTHLRVRMSTTGIRGVSSKPWKECAKSGDTLLSVPLVEDLLDKQSVPNARTHFSMDVETWMRQNGYTEAADLSKIIRNWYEASDEAGIPALERVEHLLSMRDFLLKGVNFSKFPPYGQYIEGIPVVTFEGMMLDIDTKLQLYGLTDTYNMRAVGSLAAETTVGILQAMCPNPQVSIKARDVPSLISSVVEVMTCKCNPKRSVFAKFYFDT